jgi:aspartate aminotransferase-like enzyme
MIATPDTRRDTNGTTPIDGRSGLLIALASEDWEFEQIHQLNYRTFVEEIPQHAPNAEGRLVDRFHAENRYVIARRGRTVVGMLALRTQRPFSLDGRLPDLDRWLPPGRRLVEARLLAVEPAYRKSSVFTELFGFAVRQCLDDGFDTALLSGTTRQLKLYRHLGCVPFGPLVGTEGAMYQPMYLTCEAFGRTVQRSTAFSERFSDSRSAPQPVNLLPGPVRTTTEVDDAFAAPALSHRGPEFRARLQRTRDGLCTLTGARHVQVMPGSASLGTAVVAAQLGQRASTGLVISNGEFGERLADEARRARLQFEWLRLEWGEPIDLGRVAPLIASLPRDGWLWCVHHETSTSMLNPIGALQQLARQHDVELCLDCVSSVGAVPLDLRDVFLATGSSGKGLGAYPGLALVFHRDVPSSHPDAIAGYLDLGHWAAHASTPFTHSSNLVGALEVAVHQATPERLARIHQHARWMREALHAHGARLVSPASMACDAGITFVPRGHLNALALGEALERRGYLLNFRSQHLQARNWIQLSMLGDPTRASLEQFLLALDGAVSDCGPGSGIRSHPPGAPR